MSDKKIVNKINTLAESGINLLRKANELAGENNIAFDAVARLKDDQTKNKWSFISKLEVCVDCGFIDTNCTCCSNCNSAECFCDDDEEGEVDEEYIY